ncbi:uncharacterized protein LOC107403540 [Ziziphus jujuba]|uniref:Uncharacterized protein LOC107403540 n=1 Tax=Ziziphus jujuba TaxID=326968 RepID=A0A6P3YRG7_ZIZJJ|nr:uncharacterized protein LOC107403540 [Ziziphus jujuba]
MALLGENNHWDPMPISRSESFGSGYYNYMEQNNNNNNNNNNFLYNNSSYMMMEKRQLFLKSYKFCRKKSLTERIKRSLIRVKRVIWLRLRAARRFRGLVCFRLRHGLSYRRRRFLRLLNNYHHHSKCNNSYCFW